MKSYPGAKGQSGVHQRIIGQMPPHDAYIELFVGSGTIFKIKRPAVTSILVDLDPKCLKPFEGLEGVRAVRDHAMIFLEDGKEELKGPGYQYGDLGRVLIYADPPYLFSTRKSRRYYKHEFGTEKEHARLLEVLKSLACYVMISGYPSELYGAALQGWRCCSYKTRTRGSTVTECLWCNFPEPQELHDWRWAGRNFRERLGLKRLAARWLARLEAMPARKRGYVLDAIKASNAKPGAVVPAAGNAGLGAGIRDEDYFFQDCMAGYGHLHK